MSVIEKFSTISNTMGNLMEFVATDDDIKEDYNDYLTTISAQSMTPAQMQAMLIPYIFERRLTDERKSIIEMYLQKSSKLDKFEKSVVKALGASFSSIFEIKRVLQNGFELYNLINEKAYTALSMVKMTNYRGVYSGQYAMCRIFKFEGEFYILEISNILSAAQKDEVEKFAIAKIIEKPEDVYFDNKKKLKEIENQIGKLDKKFTECFGKSEIITTNKCADNVITLFNNFCEGEEASAADIEANIQPIEKYSFFKVEEFNNSYDNFVEKSLGGFSSHKAIYDVGIIFDEDLGLFALPFYATFCKIFEVEDYKTIQGYEGCLRSFLENDKIPHNIIDRVSEKHSNFMDRVNEILSTSYTYEELIKHYKADSLEQKIFSPTSVLYSSKVFAEMMGFVIEQTEESTKPVYSGVGRNDPCPCGSGKKFKKCCMNNN